MSFAAISPHAFRFYDIRRLSKNIGDGFILRAIERHLGPISRDAILSPRQKPSAAKMARIQNVSHVVMAGANQLHDDFSPWPGLSAADIRSGTLRFAPMGVGISGKPGGGLHLTEAAKARLRAIHERIPFSSWRCPRTVTALETALPELRGQFLMTSCPVVLDRPLLEEQAFQKESTTIAATVTERNDFWERETTMLKRIAQVFPSAQKILVLHQDFSLLPANLKKAKPGDFIYSPARKLRAFARKLGFEIRVLRTPEEGIALYKNDIDIHFGSRLHAHLLMLSLNKWSYLTYVDERMAGISESLGFPLCDPARIDEYLDFDFEIVRQRAISANGTMQKFISSLSSP
jgi:hypothetical protein